MSNLTRNSGLTARQNEALRLIVIEQGHGRTVTYRSLAAGLGIDGVGAAYWLRQQLHDRLGAETIAAIVPRAPDGARLRFVTIPDLQLSPGCADGMSDASCLGRVRRGAVCPSHTAPQAILKAA
ncbi:hypothetical protein [Sphingomonas alpina]|uniref:Uncharacterized protein n=1 Tax=Sphingomonas alpina TaxID=653931 RepID=A0A7H0LHX5_9SPHN|nr:hypothetical protein [Sphingomonas alpina]QNQ09278.1 hypothetical protein H3Z74_21830 [Sphingomonas alpina]